MNNTLKQVIFLDRDGVINQEIGYLHKAGDFVFIDGVFESCLDFIKKGYEIIIITNQSGIGRGYYKKEDYQQLTQWMLNKFKQSGIKILAIYHCPHTPEDDCNCRKPKPGMLLQAQKKYQIDMPNSWMIGDKEDDITAANTANIKQTILVKSGHNIDVKNSKAQFILKSIHQSTDIIL